MGENGAGKSTLVKIIYGILHADEGEILWEGKKVAIAYPAAARALGIGMVFQHFSLFESLTVTENIALGLDKPGNMRGSGRPHHQVSERYGLPWTPAARSTACRWASAKGSRSSAACWASRAF